MKEIKAGLRIDMNGNIVSQAKRYTDEVNKFTNAGRGGLKKLGVEANKSAMDMQKLGRETMQTGADFHKFGAGVDAAKADVLALNHLITQLDAGLLHLDASLNLNTQALDRFAMKAVEAESRSGRAIRNMSKMGSRMGTLARGGAVVGGIAAAAFVTADLELEKQMNILKSNLLSSADGAEQLNEMLKQVRDTARDVSSMTFFSDAKVVEGITEMLKSGVSPNAVSGKGGAGHAMGALAQLGDMSPGEAGTFLGQVGNAFSFKTAADYGNLADYVVKAADASAQSVKSISYNASQGIANAAALHIDPKHLMAMNAYLDSLGNEAGTSVNRFLEGFTGMTPKRQKALKKMGVNAWNANGTLKPDTEVINMVRTALNKLPEKMRITVAHDAFGEEGARAALLFASKGQSFDEFLTKVDNSTGSMDKLKVQMEGLGAAAERLGNTLTSLADKQFEPLRGAVTDIINLVNDKLEGKKPKADEPRAQKGWGRVWDILQGEGEPLFPKMGYQPGGAPASGKVVLEIIGQTPARVRGMQVTSGNIEVSSRAGRHFS